MANPFLILGGVVVTVATAGIGVLQVPGWVDSAHDSAATNDLSQIALAEEASITAVGNYVGVDDLKDGEIGDVSTGVKFQPSAGVVTDLAASGDKWAAVSLSKSGHVYVRTSDSTQTFTSDKKLGHDGVTISQSDLKTKSGESIPAWVTVGLDGGSPTVSVS